MPSDLSPREALDRIAALCDMGDRDDFQGITIKRLRAVLAEVSPEPGGDMQRPLAHPGDMQSFGPGSYKSGGTLDRDQARAAADAVVAAWYRDEIGDDKLVDRILDAAAAAVRPAAIDRDALERLLEQFDLIGPHSPDEQADRVLALVRPAPAGVTLTPEEARFAADVLAASAAGRVLWPDRLNDDAEALAARLEAGAGS